MAITDDGETDRTMPLPSQSSAPPSRLPQTTPTFKANSKRTKRAVEHVEARIAASGGLATVPPAGSSDSCTGTTAAPSLTVLPIRKKQKRGTSSAASDCFACTDRSITCDRQRPYCGQCRQHERQCPGYKTTLTWGVGVASRGKLRGLSTPVSGTGSNSTTATTAIDQAASNAGQSKRTLTKGGAQSSSRPTWKGVDSTLASSQRPSNELNAPPHVIRPLHLNSHLRRKNVDGRLQQASEVVFSLSLSGDADLPTNSTTADTPPVSTAQRSSEVQRESLHLATSNTAQDALHLPHENSHDQQGHASAGDDGRPFENPSIISEPFSFFSAPAIIPNDAERGGNEFPPPHGNSVFAQNGSLFSLMHPLMMGSSAYAHNLMPTAFQQQQHFETPQDALNDYQQWGTMTTPYQQEANDDQEGPAADHHLSQVPPVVFSEAVGSTPRLKYLIRFFMEAMTPVMVTFDKPRNPYTTIGVSLARSSQTLQHAIAALAANNLRRKRENWAIVQKRKSLPFREVSRQVQAAIEKLTGRADQADGGYVPS
ncbi:hypothetical protein KEM56_003824, partial [Ascosphaera pollenicola]